MKKILAIVLILVVLSSALGVALAASTPATCTGSAVGLALIPSSIGPLHIGDTITFTVQLSMTNQNACDYQGGQLSVTFPDGTVVQVAGFGGSTPDVPLIAWLSPSPVWLVPGSYTVKAADLKTSGGVSYVETRADYGKTTYQPGQENGYILTDPPLQTASATISTPTIVINPNTKVTIATNPTSVIAGDSVTLVVSEKNTGDSDLHNVTVDILKDGNPLQTLVWPPKAGDNNSDQILQDGASPETWVWEIPNVVINADTKFTALGNATDVTGKVISFANGFTDEKAEIPVYSNPIPSVTKDATPSFGRLYDWKIEKSVDNNALTLAIGETSTVNYTVIVTANGFTDGNWAVNGNIKIQNNAAAIGATIKSLSDQITGLITPTLSCGVSFPYTIPASGSTACTYSAALPDATNRTNTATATLQNFSYDANGNPVADGTQDIPATAAITFDGVTPTETDECVTLNDSNPEGPQGIQLCVDPTKPFPQTWTYNYSKVIGPYQVCGKYTVDNCATIVTNDTATTLKSCVTVNIDVPCGGCTLTPGYWKTHSTYGPAAHPDEAWVNCLANGPDTTFFLSGKTWYQVMQVAPAGNSYYNLSFQYTAAFLNICAGASSTPAVNSAMAWAKTFFQTYTPAQALNLSKAQRQEVIKNAGILSAYNAGFIGPGHCAEQTN